MGGDAHDGTRTPAAPGDACVGGDLSRLAARAYRPSRIEIDDALRHDWLEIWYQPKIDLRSRSLVGAEALARIRHPELGVLLPKSFLPAISDLSVAHLTEHALLSVLRTWPILDEAGFNLQFAINVPFSLIQQPLFAGMAAQYRPEAEHWPGLIAEVPEAEAAADLERAQEVAWLLRGEGIAVSVDDFGPRHAAFATLRELAFAEIKLDVSVVKNCAVEPANAAVCRTAIDFAHRHGCSVVAEGIESTADLQALQLMGCDLGQGVLIAPPMPMPGFLDLLRRRFTQPASASAAAPAEAPAPGVRLPGIDRVA
jgi:EAL domain-containing protein (putative c-di-GMP-specific phosphodiesterase class I)